MVRLTLYASSFPLVFYSHCLSKGDAEWFRGRGSGEDNVQIVLTALEVGHYVTSWHLFVFSDGLFDCIIVADAASGTMKTQSVT